MEGGGGGGAVLDDVGEGLLRDPERGEFWRRVGKSGRTGIWHETFLLCDSEYETVYGNVSAKGLGKASRLARVGESSSARSRLRPSAKEQPRSASSDRHEWTVVASVAGVAWASAWP